MLAEVVGIEQASPDAHFFDDLGADSMLMARFCARVRKRDDLPSVSIKDVYGNPTVRGLATALAEATPPMEVVPSVTQPTPTARASTREFVACGVLQLLLFLGYSYLAAKIFEQGFLWISASGSLTAGYLRSVEAGAAAFFTVSTLPIAAKWVLVGRWTPRQIRVWSLGYVRFWLVKTLVAANPLVLFAGRRSTRCTCGRWVRRSAAMS